MRTKKLYSNLGMKNANVKDIVISGTNERLHEERLAKESLDLIWRYTRIHADLKKTAQQCGSGGANELDNELWILAKNITIIAHEDRKARSEAIERSEYEGRCRKN